MTKDEIREYPNGIYKVFWRSGSHSLAAIGSKSNGNKWLAPINWIKPAAKKHVWDLVKKVQKVY